MLKIQIQLIVYLFSVKKMHIEKVTGRKRNALEDMINEPIIVELKNCEIFGGNIDDYEDGFFPFITVNV